MLQKLALFLSLLAALSACNSEVEEPLRKYTEYFPVAMGDVHYFRVDSLHSDEFTGNTDTFRFNIRETIDTTYMDNAGREQFGYSVEIETDSAVWRRYKTGTITFLGDRVEKVEENRTFIKMVFPVQQDKRWLGNAPNGDPGEIKYNYEFRQVHLPYDNGLLSYDSCLQVFHYNESNVFFERSSQERYALGVGMVYKELKELDLQGDPDGFSMTLRRYNP